MNKFIDHLGCEVFVSTGLGQELWGAFRRKPNGSLQRIKPIPMVPDKN